MRARTDFSRYSHQQLHAMLRAGDPNRSRAAAESWDAVARRLHEQAGVLESQLRQFRDRWRGGAADQYFAMITDLCRGLRRTADNAFTLRNLVHDAADALARAQAAMPAPVPVPDLPAATVRMATLPVDLGAWASSDDVARARRLQSEAAGAVRAHQDALRVSHAAHARAVAVMTELAGRYGTAENAVPTSMADGVPARPAPGATGGGGAGAASGGGPLFSRMFPAGLAAASAAAAGRFGVGGRLPRVPVWALPGGANRKPGDGRPDPADAAPSPPPSATVPDPQGASPADFGGGGGLGGGGLGGADLGAGLAAGGGGSLGGDAPPPPSAHPGMLGGVSPLTAAAGAGALAAGAAAGHQRSGPGAMPMMPLMPFGGAAGDAGSGRRVPPWLTETEEVWGESAAITPSVIGEAPEPDQEPPAGRRL
ncbi:PPE family protein [Streptoalloteichus tenebrarius]|uniref:PPE family protein n=1 Tax=Streptoalloteichus tenebrarius (strain ATCC 17920 / DSM 40477 / JCM 4838 / CBS 697.72 / NBRC 16177 / NCIMB 11028 / NRRL B-12390 / A12253. 1 / ISP 5477) TaxID=1933 RepID=A0ABT1HUV8_STRSD|nr:WXG100 family type VII secretion target [Streptoalloteichus tenebrarius]MCP2259308.1 PPE family protein [Streptoalloteichus tenebrarius]BFE99071.1 WXG100 family type VII secretion target [Streptoalloteichus tenebrarius]